LQRKSEVDSAMYGLLLLTVENPNWGMRVEYPDDPKVDIGPLDVKSLDHDTVLIFATDGSPSFVCSLWTGLYIVLSYATIALACEYTFKWENI